MLYAFAPSPPPSASGRRLGSLCLGRLCGRPGRRRRRSRFRLLGLLLLGLLLLILIVGVVADEIASAQNQGGSDQERKQPESAAAQMVGRLQ